MPGRREQNLQTGVSEEGAGGVPERREQNLQTGVSKEGAGGGAGEARTESTDWGE